MVYAYCRVSTAGQRAYGNSLDDQRGQLLARYPNAVVVAETYSGYKDERPLFDELIGKLRKGDTLVVTKLDRFSRNLEKGVRTLKELSKRGVRLDILNMGVFDNTPIGNLLFNVLEAFAQYERDMIVERTSAGKEVARKKEGYREGRPRKEVDLEGVSLEEALAKYGISRSTYYRRLRTA